MKFKNIRMIQKSQLRNKTDWTLKTKVPDISSLLANLSFNIRCMFPLKTHSSKTDNTIIKIKLMNIKIIKEIFGLN